MSTSVFDAAGYWLQQCTDFVWRTTGWVGNAWGDAGNWLSSAAAHGFVTSSSPQPGAVAVWGAGRGGASSAGHVATVLGTTAGGLPVVAEENFSTRSSLDPPSGTPDIRVVSAGSLPSGYILPPAGAQFSPASVIDAVRQAGGTGLSNVAAILGGNPSNMGNGMSVLGAPPTQTATVAALPDLNPADWVSGFFDNLRDFFASVVVRLLLGVFGAILIIVALSRLAHDADDQEQGGSSGSVVPIGRATSSTGSAEEAAAA